MEIRTKREAVACPGIGACSLFLMLLLTGCHGLRGQQRWLEVTNRFTVPIRVVVDNYGARPFPETVPPSATVRSEEMLYRGRFLRIQARDARTKRLLKVVALRADALDKAEDGDTVKVVLGP